MADKKFRNFGGVIYMDSTTYNYQDVLTAGKNYFVEFGYILHDRDVDDDGVLKKPHIHWMGCKKNATTLDYVAKVMGLNMNDIEIIRNWKGAVRYLVHIDDPDKYQYEIDNIEGNIDELMGYFEQLREGEAVLRMIEQRDSGMSYKQMCYEAVKGGYYSAFRRNFGIVKAISEESEYLRDMARREHDQEIVHAKA